jgi:methyltransferase (TIGR00027 family)
MSMTTLTQPLASTAHWTAAVRAREHTRPDRLIDDPWAAALAGQEGAEWIAKRSEDSTVPIVLRTRYFDDFLARITQQDGIRQVVLLAAGLDTRAFRLTWPAGTRLFELDQPAVLEHKEQVMHNAGAQPACERKVIAMDLTSSWEAALVDAGCDPLQPSGWLLEGFLFYLPNDRVTQILDQVTSLAAPGSWLGFDIVNAITLTFPLTRPWIEMQAAAGAPWLGTMEDPAGFVAERGWLASLSQAGQPDAHHGRWTLPVIPTTLPNMPHNWFVTAQKTA